MDSISIGLEGRKKRFAIDGDEDRYIEIDTSDTGILTRWAEKEADFKAADEELKAMSDLAEQKDTEAAKAVLRQFDAINKRMREAIDYLFDYPVCDAVVGPNGSVIRFNNAGDPVFYAIIDAILPKYEADIKRDAERARKKIEKHTAKYQNRRK